MGVVMSSIRECITSGFRFEVSGGIGVKDIIWRFSAITATAFRKGCWSLVKASPYGWTYLDVYTFY